MPKLKTHRGAAKRFKRTKNGKFLRGHAFTGVGSLVLDVFHFADREGLFRTEGEHPQFDRLLSDVVAGRTDVTALLQHKEPAVLHRRTPPVIYFDNDHSPRYTVLELVADDRTGLLHRISRVISRRGCEVDLVLIATEGEKAIDVFHITATGAKLTDTEQIELTADLTRMLEGNDEVDQGHRATQ